MLGFTSSRRPFRGFRRGDAVTVRPLKEILATLDADGKHDGMPFMPEMARFCGSTLRIYRRVGRTCVEGVGLRGIRHTVLLDAPRCDGSAHAGCQRGCMFFWKEAWLKPGDPAALIERVGDCPNFPVSENGTVPFSGPNEVVLTNPGDQEAIARLPTTKGDRFFCQSTELAHAATDPPPSGLASYWADWRAGELDLRQLPRFLGRAVATRLLRTARGRGLHQLTGQQKTTLTEELDLQPGELVEIKSAAEIKATLDPSGRNRGLSFEPEMSLHCGRRYRVAAPVRVIILEDTGEMVRLNNTVTLKGLVCQGICTRNCPRANLFYWREIWLRRV